LELAAARKKRRNVIMGFTLLSGIVVAAMVLAVIFQRKNAENEKLRGTAETKTQEAEQRLAEVQQKEQERLAEMQAKLKAEIAKKAVDIKLDAKEEDLRRTLAELQVLYGESQDNLKKAVESQARAEREEAAAKAAKSEAVASKDEAVKAKAEAEAAYL